ncbi:hypothetical protein [Tenacibaculum sp.]|uniref:hypothetical protein n=1 Tax=Tenacibaculum sp. TaxID=1906242 RepID=UPI003D0D8E52
MKKSILNLGKVLEKTEQKQINGGLRPSFLCSSNFFCALDCQEGDVCAVPDGTGGVYRGTIKNGQCCPS